MRGLCSRLRCRQDSLGSKSLPRRAEWSHSAEFLLSTLGYCIGLGNIWRFPYLCYRNGGGAFLIPYMFFLVVCGIPIVFLELAIGQYAGAGPLGIWSICPLAKGIGVAMAMLSLYCCVYYNVIITWALYYLFHSFSDPLPWAHCGNTWNSGNCQEFSASKPRNQTLCGNASDQCLLLSDTSSQPVSNQSQLQINQSRLPYPAEEFWERQVLSVSSGIDDLVTIRWDLALILLLAWTLVFLCLINGIKTSGKVVYVTATAPYILLTILLIQGAAMPGSLDGVKYYMVPDFKKLANYNVWAEACGQIFYSLAASWGGLITLSSYNQFNTNIYRYALAIPIIDCTTSIYAGFVIFSVLGAMARAAGISMDLIVNSGPGLIFVAYPYAISQLPLPQLWAVLFFTMVLTVGLDSQFGTFETFTTSIFDELPLLFKTRLRKSLFTAAMCIASYLVGLLCVTHAGIYYFQLMDWYISIFSLLLIAFLECVIVSWVYGADRFYKDIELMIGYQPMAIFKVMWKAVTPSIVMTLFVFSLATYEPPLYNRTYVYPMAAVIIFWMYGISSSLPIPGYVAYLMWITRGEQLPLRQRLKKYLLPAEAWGARRDLFTPTAGNHHNDLAEDQHSLVTGDRLTTSRGDFEIPASQINVTASAVMRASAGKMAPFEEEMVTLNP